MVISGSFYGTTGNSAIKPKITWSATENIEGNYSDVTATLSYSRTDSYMTYGYWAGSLTINGDQKSVSGKYIEITKNSNTVSITHTVRIPHDDDGTKTITISASGGITGTTLTKTTISGSVPLTSIPRAASIAATDADIGSVSMVSIGKKSDIYTYTVAYQFGNLSGYLSESGLTEEAVPVAASSLAFPLPESFYYEIPAKASDICTLTCTTFLDGSAIGTPQQCAFTVRADPARCAPLLTVMAEDSNPVTLALTGDKNTFIRYTSTALCGMTAQARYGASVREKKIAGQTIPENTLTLEKVEEDTVSFTVRDSRGYTAETVIALELLPYFMPTLRVSAARTDATSGEAELQVTGSFYNADFGQAANELQVQFQLDSGEAVRVEPQIDGNGFSFRQLLQGLDYTQAYSVSVTVTDGINTQKASARINPGIPVFDWGKADFAFHAPVSMSGSRITDLADPAASGDAVPLGYAQKTFLKTSGDQAMSGNLDIKPADLTAFKGFRTFRKISADAVETYMAQFGMTPTPGAAVYFYKDSGDGKGNVIQNQLTLAGTYTSLRQPLNIASGGTEAKTAAEALANLGGVSIKKLWENANTANSFAAQTISLDLSAYDLIMIDVWTSNSGSNPYGTMHTVRKGERRIISNFTTLIHSRPVTVSDTGVSFEAGRSHNTYSSYATSNTSMVPVAIYGIKGVS